MRLRVQTNSPLPIYKVWYTSDSLETLSTISELKSAFCGDLQPLKDASINARDIILLLEGFELLDDSPFNILRDGDIISIKMASSMRLPVTIKRKASPVEEKDTKCSKRRKISPASSVIGPSPGAASESNSSSEENSSGLSDLSSDSDSDSSSSSSSSASSSSSSPSSSPPRAQASKSRRIPTRPLIPNGPLVPPGYGKPSTRSRNSRRRLKRMHEKAALSGPPAPPGSSISNLLPLGTKSQIPIGLCRAGGNISTPGPIARPDDVTPTGFGESALSDQRPAGADGVMMSSLQNKNKKKGFKNSLAGPLPPKIVFNDSSQADCARESVELIPPSEKQVMGRLPENMFVTSVDVEEGRWKKKKKNAQTVGPGGVGGRWAGGELNYGSPQAPDSTRLPVASADDSSFDWHRMENEWDSMVQVATMEQLLVGVRVGWMGLAINPFTFTPEMLLTVARVVAVPPTGSSLPLRVRLFARPGAGSVSFSNRIIDDRVKGEEEGEEQEYDWEAIQSGGWRIVGP